MIFKLQQGGNTIAPLVSYQPVLAKVPTPLLSTSLNPKKQNFSDNYLMEALKLIEGLPNDVSEIIDNVLKLYINLKYSPTQDTSNLELQLFNILKKIKTAKFNNDLYNKTLDLVSKNDSLNEIAIDSNGYVFCSNKDGDYKRLKPEDIKYPSGYIPVTNSELLLLRSKSPELTHNTSLFQIVLGGISIKNITELILKEIDKLGTSLEKNAGYVNTKAKRLISGLEDFVKAVLSAQGLTFNGSVHDLYKYSYLNKGQAMLAQEAMKFIYNALPENAKSLLKMKANEHTEKGAYDMISSLVASQIDSTRDFDVDLIGGKTSKSSEKDSSKLETSLPLNVLKGIGGHNTNILIDKGNGNQLSVYGNYTSQLKTPEGKPITDTSLANMLSESGLLSIISDTKNVTFGDLKISPELWKNITYNNTGLVRTILPINPDGSVRLLIIDDYEKAQNEIKLLGDNPSSEKIIEIYKKYKIADLLDTNGKPNVSKFGAFMVTEGYTTSQNGIKDSEYVKNKKDVSDDVIDLIKASLTTKVGDKLLTIDIDKNDWYNPLDWLGWYDNIYKAAIYIPVSNNVNTAVLGANLSLDYDEATEQELKYRNFNKLVGMKPTSADIL